MGEQKNQKQRQQKTNNKMIHLNQNMSQPLKIKDCQNAYKKTNYIYEKLISNVMIEGS